MPIEAQAADDLIPDILLAAQVVHAVAAKYGLTVNLSQGKTESLAAPRGKGAPAVRASLASARSQGADVASSTSLLSIGDLGQLRVVQVYTGALQYWLLARKLQSGPRVRIFPMQ